MGMLARKIAFPADCKFQIRGNKFVIRQAHNRPRNPPRPDNSFIKFLAIGLFWLLILRVLVPGSFDYGHVNMLEVVQRDALFNKVTWLSFAVLSGSLVLARLTDAIRLIRAANPFFVILLIYATSSVLWSIDPTASLARLFHIATVVIACLAVALIDWQKRRFQDVMRPIVTALLLGSIIFGLVRPDLAVESPIPPDTSFRWHGLADQKNQLGALASMGVVFWIHAWAAREKTLSAAALWGGVSVACLVLSRSATSLIATILVCGFLLLMLRSSRAVRRYMPYVIGLLVSLTLIYGLAVLNVVPGLDALLTPVADLAGKDRTFSNRAQIWALIQDHIRLSPVLGSGYGAYWTGPRPSSPSFVFVYKMFFYPGECHSGYLEIINDLGYVGLLLLFGYLWYFIRQCLSLLNTNYSQAGLYFAMLFQQLLTNMSESHWFFLQTDFIMFTFATLCLAHSSVDRDERLQNSRSRPPSMHSAIPRTRY
jgi:exopolysaccharide production protein ExoQ